MGPFLSASSEAKEPPPTTVEALVRGNNAFAFELNPRVGHDSGNRVFSPFSISTALAMTYAGALDETAQEMAKTLRFTVPPDQLHRAFHRLIVELKSRNSAKAESSEVPDLQLFSANALWHQVGDRILADFQKQVEVQYLGGVFPINFRSSKIEALRAINTWVEDQTRNKIRDLIKPDQIGQGTRLVLTNALYFKGLWANPFSEQRTAMGDFHVSASETIKTPLMNQTERFRYVEAKEFRALELPYKGRSLSFVLLLPKAVDGLPALESSLSAESLSNVLGGFSPHRVDVTLPRFKVTSEFELKPALSALGMVRAFDPTRADFSGMTGTRDFSLSAVIHKAFIDVQEAGTEAAAATAVVMMRSAMVVPTEPVVFRADHPFLFLIRDIRTGTILFLGRFVKPEA